MKSTTVTRLLALLYLFMFVFGVWSCRHSKDLGKVVERDVNVHVKGYYNSRIMYIDFDNKLVQVLTMEGTRKDILFEAEDEFLDFLRLPGNKAKIGWILPVTFVCGKKSGKECDINKPYVLYVATRKVKPLIIKKNSNNG